MVYEETRWQLSLVWTKWITVTPRDLAVIGGISRNNGSHWSVIMVCGPTWLRAHKEISCRCSNIYDTSRDHKSEVFYVIPPPLVHPDHHVDAAQPRRRASRQLERDVRSNRLPRPLLSRFHAALLQHQGPTTRAPVDRSARHHFTQCEPVSRVLGGREGVSATRVWWPTPRAVPALPRVRVQCGAERPDLPATAPVFLRVHVVQATLFGWRSVQLAVCWLVHMYHIFEVSKQCGPVYCQCCKYLCMHWVPVGMFLVIISWYNDFIATVQYRHPSEMVENILFQSTILLLIKNTIYPSAHGLKRAVTI